MAIRCLIVTPGRTEADRRVQSLVLPMFDGELGVRRGRAAMIGRLGYGQLRLSTDSGEEAFFIDGGFVQVENDVVSVLTSRAIPARQLDRAKAEAELAAALAEPAETPERQQLKDIAVRRARGLLRTTRRRA